MPPTRTKTKEPPKVAEVVEHVSKAPCSVEFGRNAKGQRSWTVKVYCEADGLDQAVDQAVAVDKRFHRETKDRA